MTTFTAVSNPFKFRVVASTAAWVPSAGEVGIVPMTNHFYDSGVDPCPANNCFYNQNYNGTGNEHAITGESGGYAAPELGVLGSIVVTGGGHGDYGGNEVYQLDLAGPTWIRLSDPTNLPSVDAALGSVLIGDVTWAELEDGQPGSTHSYQNLIVLPPGLSGGPKGTLLLVVSTAAGNESRNSGGTHGFDLNNPTQKWSRWSNNLAISNLVHANGTTCHDTVRNVIWQTYHSGHFQLNRLDVATKTWDTSLTTVASFGGSLTQCLMMFYHEPTDRVICLKRNSVTPNDFRIYWGEAGSMASTAWTRATLSGVSVPNVADGTRAMGGAYCPDNEKIYFVIGAQTGGIYELTVPPIGTDAWPIALIPLAGDAAAQSAWSRAIAFTGSDNNASWNRFAWCEKVGCIVWPHCARVEATIAENEMVLSFKPPGI